MSIKFRVHMFQVIVAAVVLMMAGVVYATIRWTDYQLKRVEITNHQLEAITALTVNANRFSEQIAEYLLIGEPERPDFDSARSELEAGFKRLEQTIKMEFDFFDVYGMTLEDKRDELFRLDRMRTLYQQMNEALKQIFLLRDQGKQDEAVLMFRREIENRFDAEFESLLTAAALDETEEVDRAERGARALWRRLAWITAATTLAAFVVSGLAGLSLLRRLTRPIKLLTGGTEAIARGELDHRIAYDSPDELGALARRFNQMAAERQRQRGLLLDAQTGLEKEVAARTEELAAANKRLSDIDHMRVQFLADISHEIRTPLTALRGEAEIALRHGSKPEAVYRDALGRIVAHTSDMSHLVDDLMFLARSETDTLRFEPRPLVLQDLLAEALRESEVLGRAMRVAVEAECPDDQIWIDADAQRLKQALMILLDNAIKYSPPGRPVTVEVTAAQGDAEISVRNEGVGIPTEELPYVFDRFYRGRSSSASKPLGSGLGLAIAKWLVEKHGGEIAVASTPNNFTEIRMRLPLAQVTSFVESSARRG